MAETQPQTDYRYIPASAQSTRQLLDLNPPPTSTNTEEVSMRPAKPTRRSSNYADADARARAAVVDAHASAAQEERLAKGEEGPETPGTAGASASWKPTYGRRQSWSMQDLKREMHMSTVIDAETGPGFTEIGNGNQS